MANPKTSRATGRSFSRRVAPFIPLALPLMVNPLSSARGPEAAASSAEEAESGGSGEARLAVCDDVSDVQDCHTRYPTGCSTAGKYDAYVNLLKNKVFATVPPASRAVTLADVLTLEGSLPVPGKLTGRNHGDFAGDLAKLGEGENVALVGYLYYFKATGAESCNCGLTDPDGVDFHIGIGDDLSVARLQQGRSVAVAAHPSKLLQQQSVIVEMTPYQRFLYHPDDWTLANLQKALGHQVRVTGQLLVDNDHYVPGQDCGVARTSAQRSSCWRAAVWELHPVVRFEYCSNSADDCSANAGDWRLLGADSGASEGITPPAC